MGQSWIIYNIKYGINRKITGKLIDPHSSLSKKFNKTVIAKEAMAEQLSTIRYGFSRPNFTEFRRAYMEYAKSTIQYRLSKGKEIFDQLTEKAKKPNNSKENEYGDK